MTTRRTLRGITWDHPRGIDPLRHLSSRFAQMRPDIRIEWSLRPLRSFEDVPLSELASGQDLIAFDHPFTGAASRDRVLVDLEEHLTPAELQDRRDDVMGASHESYRRDGRQWALAFDAACMVTATRPDLLGQSPPPRTWAETHDLLRDLGRARALLAANPTHLWGTVLSLCHALDAAGRPEPDGAEPRWWNAAGIPSDLLAEAVERAREVLDLCAPDSLGLDPVAVLDRMSRTDDIALSPLVFAYVTYARQGQAHPLRFHAAPSYCGQPVGTLTGGVGLGVVRESPAVTEAVAFAAFATSPSAQRDMAVHAGGQPARRTAWEDPAANAETNDFFTGCAPTMARSFLRPRGPGYPRFQRRGAAALHDGVVRGARSSEIARTVAALWTPDGV